MKQNLTVEIPKQPTLVETKKNTGNKKMSFVMLLLPVLFLFLLFFFVPMIVLFITSFRTFNQSIGVTNHWTLHNYAQFLSDSSYLLILWRTLRIGFITTIICLIIAYPFAYQLIKLPEKLKRLATLLVLSPLLISMVIRSYGWGILLGKNGLINQLLVNSGMIQTPLTLMYTEFSVILGMVHVVFPYMVLSIMGSLERIDSSLIRASKILGAGSMRAFFGVTLPLSLPGIFAGSVMVFSLTVSSFVTPSILGGAKVKVMSYLTYEQFTNTLNWPYGAAIGFILVLISVITLIVYSRILSFSKKGVTFQ
ncbi:ABC transporter permease [Heyndrickxia acidiproducens]|uniref:ABC transporter permease n=1 Tax=Heyndrickxia acidiproducens TaxID=1121084 RepID=UPI00037B6184|nr:ABC transporter permease [Heyndrickxia acidiproducens]